MTNPIEDGENITSRMATIGGMNDAKSTYEFVVVAEQAVAFMSAAALNPVTAGLAIATNAGAAVGVIGKMLSDMQNGKSVSTADLASLAGNVAVIATAIVISDNPYSRAAQVASAISRGIGWVGMSQFFISKARADEARFVDPTFTRYFQRSDPFALDLNGNGLETVGDNAVGDAANDGMWRMVA